MESSSIESHVNPSRLSAPNGQMRTSIESRLTADQLLSHEAHHGFLKGSGSISVVGMKSSTPSKLLSNGAQQEPLNGNGPSTLASATPIQLLPAQSQNSVHLTKNSTPTQLLPNETPHELLNPVHPTKNSTPTQLLPNETPRELLDASMPSAFDSRTAVAPVASLPATVSPSPPTSKPKTVGTSRKDPTSVKIWNAMYERLVLYRQIHGNCLVPRSYPEDPRLGNWVSKQRANRATLSSERKEKLDAIDFTWCVTARETWDSMYQRLVDYRNEYGDCLVPYHYHKEDPKLVTWIYKQRTMMKKGSLSDDRVAKLDAIGFVWFPQRNEWDAMLALLTDWRTKHGHCRVPFDYDQDPELSEWVFTQRRNRQKLSRERKKKLESIGFEWHPIQRDMWDVMYSRLQAYKARHGNTLVPQRYPEDPKLGRWITLQRENKDIISPEKKDQLDAIGFVWTVVQREPWNNMYRQLCEYKAQRGDCLVPQRFKENPRLGGWVREQRKRKDSLPPERKQLLDAIGFSWRAKGRPKEELMSCFTPPSDDWLPEA